MSKFRPAAKRRGFSLIEMMVALVIIAILVALAYPSYKDKVYRGRRAEATTSLANLANRLEYYYGQNNTYSTATIASGNASTDVLSIATTASGYYTLSIQAATTTAYTIQAAPNGVQAGDTKCGTLSLTSTNVKTVSGTGTVATCW